MLSSYNLVIDITATERNLSEQIFREQVSQGLAYLEALKGSLGRVPCKIVYYPPGDQHGSAECWSVRVVVINSVGKKRAIHLMNLYRAIARLIELELNEFRVQVEISQFDFS